MRVRKNQRLGVSGAHVVQPPLCWNTWAVPNSIPRGSIYTTIMELGPQNPNGDGLLGPNSIIVVYMDVMA